MSLHSVTVDTAPSSLASWTFHPSASLSFHAGVRLWSCHSQTWTFLTLVVPYYRAPWSTSPLPLYCRHTYLLVQTFPLLCWFCSVEGRLPTVLTPVVTSAFGHHASSHPCPVVCTAWTEGSSQQCFSGYPQVNKVPSCSSFPLSIRLGSDPGPSLSPCSSLSWKSDIQNILNKYILEVWIF